MISRCLGLFQIVSGLFDFVSRSLGCSCCFELFPLILVQFLVVDCFSWFQSVFRLFCVVLNVVLIL